MEFMDLFIKDLAVKIIGESTWHQGKECDRTEAYVEWHVGSRR
jgi:hypothetical protein